ncbi:MAG: STAS domain-containing protein [Candidatus Eisenbacteria bacterium]|nr:STAS domain-containing protein [Candidatus Eisenbacteria bacterium]
MTIRSTVTEQAAVVEMTGSMAALEMGQLHTHLLDLIRARRRKIVLDFQAVDHVSYQHASQLAREFEFVRSYNGDLRVAGLSPYVRNILLFAGLSDFLDSNSTGVETLDSARVPQAS